MRHQTDLVTGLQGQQASSALSHQHEFAADAYGLQALQSLGLGRQRPFTV
jgi:hypothetical protein